MPSRSESETEGRYGKSVGPWKVMAQIRPSMWASPDLTGNQQAR